MERLNKLIINGEEYNIAGDSAYETAVKNGFEGTEEEWLESLKGDDGDKGDEGDSAYKIAVSNGFEGTEEEWLESLKADTSLINAQMLNAVSRAKDYTDTHLTKKLDKATPNADYTVLYALKTNGEHTTQRLTPHAVGNTVMFRDSNGYCKVGEPAKDEHIANKGYVDNEIVTLRVEIEALKALVDKLNKQLNPMAEVWRIREDANIWDCYWARWDINFTANGEKFTGIGLGGDGDPILCYYRPSGAEVHIMGMSYSGEVNTEDYLTIKFVRDKISNESFIAWLEANAEFIGEEEYVEPEALEMISFRVAVYTDTYDFYCPQGMTWEEFIASEYNTTDREGNGFCIDNWGMGDVVCYRGDTVYRIRTEDDHGFETVYTTDVINGDYSYTLG